MKGWVSVPTETLRAARQRLGLSYKTMAEVVPIGMSRYIRWEREGRVGSELFDRIAEVLELDVTRPEPIQVLIAEPPDALSMLQALDRRLEAVETQLGELQTLLRSVLSQSEPGDEDRVLIARPQRPEFEAAEHAR